jgi:hypothetical protein
MDNKGAFIRFEEDLKPKYTTFKHVKHPDVPPFRPSAMGFDFGSLLR